MAGIGANGSVTTYPGSGEKICAGCEYWQGQREVAGNGFAAHTLNNRPAACPMKKADVYPGNVCSCMPSKFKKWTYLK